MSHRDYRLLGLIVRQDFAGCYYYLEDGRQIPQYEIVENGYRIIGSALYAPVESPVCFGHDTEPRMGHIQGDSTEAGS